MQHGGRYTNNVQINMHISICATFERISQDMEVGTSWRPVTRLFIWKWSSSILATSRDMSSLLPRSKLIFSLVFDLITRSSNFSHLISRSPSRLYSASPTSSLHSCRHVIEQVCHTSTSSSADLRDALWTSPIPEWTHVFGNRYSWTRNFGHVVLKNKV